MASRLKINNLTFKSFPTGLVLSLALAHQALAAGSFDATVDKIGVVFGAGCITLNNGEIVKVDVNTAAGQAEFSLALTAASAGRKLRIYQTDDPLVGGCNTGTVIKPHNFIIMLSQ